MIIEYYRETQSKMSQIQNPAPPYRFLKIGLIKERHKLYKDIDKRVDRMIELGLIEEVKKLKEECNQWSKTAQQAIGYKEILAFLDGKISLDEAIRLIKQHTRNFAKRQITWFKKERDVIWIDVEDFDKAYTEVKRLVGEFLNEN
jgi:tRNA dimethylallyltransferase